MDPSEVEIQVLLSEKDHADRQIAAYSELQLKLLTFLFAAASAALGFVLAKGKDAIDPAQVPVVLVVVSVAGCVVMLQSVVTYGIALGYIHYKKAVLAPRLQSLAGMPAPPPLTVGSFATSPARYPVFFASAILGALHFVVTIALLAYAGHLWTLSASRTAVLMGSWALLGATLVIEIRLAIAMKTVGTIT
jgi:hypothetical protein